MPKKEELTKEIIDTMDDLNFASRESVRVICEDMLPEIFYYGVKKEN